MSSSILFRQDYTKDENLRANNRIANRKYNLLEPLIISNTLPIEDINTISVSQKSPLGNKLVAKKDGNELSPPSIFKQLKEEKMGSVSTFGRKTISVTNPRSNLNRKSTYETKNIENTITSLESDYYLDNYKDIDIRYYLDGRYFKKVLELTGYEGLITKPLIIRFDDEISGNFNDITYDIDYEYPNIIRMILEIDESSEKNPGQTRKDVLYGSRHSNLLIIDHKKNVITRFEPLKGFLAEEDEKQLNEMISEMFAGYDVITDKRHPQNKNKIHMYCNAYVIKYAYDFVNERPIDLPDKNGISKFSALIEYNYGPLSPNEDGGPDIEFGNGLGTGILLGGLGGAALGGLAGGASGAVIGGVAGAALGGTLGAASTRRRKY